MTVSPNPRRNSAEEGEAFLPHTDPPDAPLRPAKKKPWLLLIGLVFALITFIDIGAYLADPPQTRIFEANLCLKYYLEQDPSVIEADGTIPEKLCKVDIVQQRLASIMGWAEMFMALPGLLLAIPYGTLADKIGRKWIFTASLVGIVLNFAWSLLICQQPSGEIDWTLR